MMSTVAHEVSMRRPVEAAQSSEAYKQSSLFSVLTQRETEIALLAALPDKLIAEELKIGIGTVRAHIQNVFRKTGLERRAICREVGVVTYRASCEESAA